MKLSAIEKASEAYKGSAHLRKVWCGDPPETCDICKAPITSAFVDGRTSMGPWANMCLKCHAAKGTGLGTGCGQQYEKQCNASYTSFDGSVRECTVKHTLHVGSKHKAYTDFGQPIVFTQDECTVEWVKVRG